jgi:hypothetical protein
VSRVRGTIDSGCIAVAACGERITLTFSHPPPVRHTYRSTVAVLSSVMLVACSGKSTSDQPAADTPATAAPVSQAPAPSGDAEFEQVKKTTPLVACELLTLEEVGRVIPAVQFSALPSKPPQMSGYAWDSRCEYQAGVGTMEISKETPTHVVQIFVNTVVNEAKALANLKSRAETAVSTTRYTPRPELGPSAYTIANVGYVSVFFSKGQAEIQINVSDILESTYDQKVARVLALAKAI